MGERFQDIPWRQGHVLSAESAKQLELVHPQAGDDPVTLVISHDCDIAASEQTEPDCEAIPGRHIAAPPDGNYTHAKNPRKLHLTFSAGKVPVLAEFVSTDKQIIRKELLFPHTPSENARLTPSELTVLQSWLALRYRRPSFANEFVSRFARGKFYAEFIKIVRRASIHLLAVLLDVDEGAEIERDGPDDTYSLSVHLLFNVTGDPATAEVAVKAAARDMIALFEKTFRVEGRWQNIELRECDAISEGTISLFESRLYKQWQFEFLSLREEPQGAIMDKPVKC